MWHRPRRRKPHSYRNYCQARERREEYAARCAAEHPQPAKPSFQATIRLADRTKAAARACGERMARDCQ
ncbi:MAG TPA: hypothetical protein VKD26_08210 [Streptosporangiaceae bacterium]|nr:hypothetical protein [Streptosporangiaceae bacterium]